MILAKTDRDGNFEILENGDLGPVVEIFNELTDEYEQQGKMLISDEGLTREFATIEGGWDCVLIVAHGLAGAINVDD